MIRMKKYKHYPKLHYKNNRKVINENKLKEDEISKTKIYTTH